MNPEKTHQLHVILPSLIRQGDLLGVEGILRNGTSESMENAVLSVTFIDSAKDRTEISLGNIPNGGETSFATNTPVPSTGSVILSFILDSEDPCSRWKGSLRITIRSSEGNEPAQIIQIYGKNEQISGERAGYGALSNDTINIHADGFSKSANKDKHSTDSLIHQTVELHRVPLTPKTTSESNITPPQHQKPKRQLFATAIVITPLLLVAFWAVSRTETASPTPPSEPSRSHSGIVEVQSLPSVKATHSPSSNDTPPSTPFPEQLFGQGARNESNHQTIACAVTYTDNTDEAYQFPAGMHSAATIEPPTLDFHFFSPNAYRQGLTNELWQGSDSEVLTTAHQRFAPKAWLAIRVNETSSSAKISGESIHKSVTDLHYRLYTSPGTIATSGSVQAQETAFDAESAQRESARVAFSKLVEKLSPELTLLDQTKNTK